MYNIVKSDVNSSRVLQDYIPQAISLRCNRSACTQTHHHIFSSDVTKSIQLLNSGKEDGYVNICYDIYKKWTDLFALCISNRLSSM